MIRRALSLGLLLFLVAPVAMAQKLPPKGKVKQRPICFGGPKCSGVPVLNLPGAAALDTALRVPGTSIRMVDSTSDCQWTYHTVPRIGTAPGFDAFVAFDQDGGGYPGIGTGTGFTRLFVLSESSTHVEVEYSANVALFNGSDSNSGFGLALALDCKLVIDSDTNGFGIGTDTTTYCAGVPPGDYGTTPGSYLKPYLLYGPFTYVASVGGFYTAAPSYDGLQQYATYSGVIPVAAGDRGKPARLVFSVLGRDLADDTIGGTLGPADNAVTVCAQSLKIGY